jgi:hypothetical protein
MKAERVVRMSMAAKAEQKRPTIRASNITAIVACEGAVAVEKIRWSEVDERRGAVEITAERSSDAEGAMDSCEGCERVGYWELS